MGKLLDAGIEASPLVRITQYSSEMLAGRRGDELESRMVEEIKLLGWHGPRGDAGLCQAHA